jgi:hypothetical protein
MDCRQNPAHAAGMMEKEHLAIVLTFVLFLGLFAAGSANAGYLGFSAQSLQRQTDNSGDC